MGLGQRGRVEVRVAADVVGAGHDGLGDALPLELAEGLGLLLVAHHLLLVLQRRRAVCRRGAGQQVVERVDVQLRHHAAETIPHRRQALQVGHQRHGAILKNMNLKRKLEHFEQL